VRRYLAVNLARLRAEKGWTQKQASEATGVDANHLQKLEYARANPTLETLVRVAQGFGATLTELLAPNAARVPRRPRGRPRARGTQNE
jgi:transcriptional regulator with XRE-family HTH domain